MKVIISVLFVVAVAYAELKCPEAQETDWNIEHLLAHGDCDKFYKCTFGQPVEQLCYGGLWFNLDNWQCDWPENVKCEDRKVPGGESPEASHESEESPEVQPKPEPQPKPEKQSSEEATIEEKESSEQVEKSEEAVTQESEDSQNVSEEKEENEDTEEEDQNQSESDCEESESSEEEKQPDSVFQENGCPVDPHVHWLLPHENDCNQFYYCVWGEKVLRQCSPTLHFNRALQVCDWPADAGCTASADKHYASRLAYRNMLL